MHEVLVYCLFKLAQEKVLLGLTDHLDMAIAVDQEVKPQKNKESRFYRFPRES